MNPQERNPGGRGAVLSWLRRLLRTQRGSLLMETTIVLAAFGLLGAAVLTGVQTSFLSKRLFDNQSMAENLIRNQMEYVFEQPYKPPGDTYLPITTPDGYSVTVDTLVYDETSTDVEIIRVTVYHNAQLVKAFETLRSNR
ncbi:MAG: type II secretion system protein [Dehalococcoidia bacterium]